MTVVSRHKIVDPPPPNAFSTNDDSPLDVAVCWQARSPRGCRQTQFQRSRLRCTSRWVWQKPLAGIDLEKNQLRWHLHSRFEW